MSLRIFWGFIPHPSHGVIFLLKLFVDGDGCVFVFLSACACGELVVGKAVGFLLHVHVWASEYKMKYMYQNYFIFPLE